MPITVRPSDVAFAAADAFSKWGETFQQIFSAEYEKERIKQVNSGLITLEESWQKQLDDAPIKEYKSYPSSADGKTSTTPLPPVSKSLGQLTPAELLNDFHESTLKLRENIERTVTNKKAKEEMLQHLAAGSIQQQARLMGTWKKAAEAHEKSTLITLAETVQSDPLTTAPQKMEKIDFQLNRMLAAGMIEEDEAKIFRYQQEQKAVFFDAYNGAMKVFEETKDIVAAQNAVLAFEPYKANPVAQSQVLQAVEAKWNAYVEKTNAAEGDFYSKAIASMDPKQLLVGLERIKAEKNPFVGDKRDDIRYGWWQRMQQAYTAVTYKGGGDPDKDDDPAIAKEYMDIVKAFRTNTPLLYAPEHAHLNPIKAGSVPNVRQIIDYLSDNTGMSVDGKPQLARSHAQSQFDYWTTDTPPEADFALKQIEQAMVFDKEKNPNPLDMTRGLAYSADLRAQYKNGKITAAQWGERLLSYLARERVNQATEGAGGPEGLGTGKFRISNVEQFVGWANTPALMNWEDKLKSLGDVGRADRLKIESMLNQMKTNIEKLKGPGANVMMDPKTGEVQFEYEVPGKGFLYYRYVLKGKTLELQKAKAEGVWVPDTSVEQPRGILPPRVNTLTQLQEQINNKNLAINKARENLKIVEGLKLDANQTMMAPAEIANTIETINLNIGGLLKELADLRAQYEKQSAQPIIKPLSTIEKRRQQ